MDKEILKLMENYLNGMKNYENDFIEKIGKDLKMKSYKSSEIATSILAPLNKNDNKKLLLSNKTKVISSMIKENKNKILPKVKEEVIKNYVLEYASPNSFTKKDDFYRIVEKIKYSMRSKSGGFMFENIETNLKPFYASFLEDIQYTVFKYKKLLESSPIKFLSKYGKLVKRNKRLLKFVGEADETVPVYSSNQKRLSELVDMLENELKYIKQSFEDCNTNFDTVEKIGNCQLEVLEKSLEKLKKIMDYCQNNEECRSNFIRVIGRLEIMYDKIAKVVGK